MLVFSVFKYQQDLITQNECIERDKAESSCHGSCVLTERLAKPLNELPANDSEPILVQVKMEFFIEVEEELLLYPVMNPAVSSFTISRELEGFVPIQIKPPQSV